MSEVSGNPARNLRTWRFEDKDPCLDYQRMADQINFAMGYVYTAEDMEAILASIVRKPMTKFDFDGYVMKPGQTIQLSATLKTQPERVYRVNPKMSSVDILRQALYDAQNRKGDI